MYLVFKLTFTLKVIVTFFKLYIDHGVVTFRPPYNNIVHKCQRIAFKNTFFLTMYFFFAFTFVYISPITSLLASFFFVLFCILLHIFAYCVIVLLSFCLIYVPSVHTVATFTNTKSLSKILSVFFIFFSLFIFNCTIKCLKDIVRHNLFCIN